VGDHRTRPTGGLTALAAEVDFNGTNGAETAPPAPRFTAQRETSEALGRAPRGHQQDTHRTQPTRERHKIGVAGGHHIGNKR